MALGHGDIGMIELVYDQLQWYPVLASMISPRLPERVGPIIAAQPTCPAYLKGQVDKSDDSLLVRDDDGKIVGESLVASVQSLGIVLFGFVVGVPLSLPQLINLLPVGIIICLLGAAFGVLILSNLGSRRAADQVFNFIMLPQYFLAGVFNPIHSLPVYADALSHLSPLRYAIDLTRGIF